MTTGKVLVQLRLIDSDSGCEFSCHIVADSEFERKDRILTLVKSSSFSVLTQIYKTMCSEQNSSVGYLFSNVASLQHLIT